MNQMTDMFDFTKSFEQFSKFTPDFANAAPMKAFNDMAAKYRAVAIEALNKNVELTTAWMTDAAKDATTLMSPETQPTAYAKKAGEMAQAAMQDIPARMMAYAEVAKKAQSELMDSVATMTPKVVEEATAQAKAAVKSAKKA